MSKPVILTGLRANNDLHIGNYLGALLPMVDMAREKGGEYQVNLFIPDLHSFTTPIDHDKLQAGIMQNLRVFAAAGLPLDNPDVHIYRQSYVPAHSELTWILDCFTGLGEMSRMTQFKDKSGSLGDDRISLGLFNYPVLMAADIVLYGATHVPVGDDQKQHVEFARDIVQVFNNMAADEILKMPEPVIQKSGARIKSLRDGLKKMSKSDASDYSRINLNDDNDLIALKIKKAKTDPNAITGDIKSLENRPELENLIILHALLENKSTQDVLSSFDGQNFSNLKLSLTDLLIDHVSPIREKVNTLLNDQAYLNSCLKDGADRANIVAQQTMQQVRTSLNLLQI